MASNNSAVWFDNAQKYKEGDIALFYLSDGEVRVGVISSYIKHPLTEKQKDYESDRIASSRNCCGKPGRKIKMAENYFVYHIETTGDKHIVSENRIISVGIDGINKRFEELQEEISSLRVTIQNTAEALGYE